MTSTMNKNPLLRYFRISEWISRKTGTDKKMVYRLLIRCMAPDKKRALKILSDCNFFLVLSTGRTGTMWLTDLLSNAAGACVMHEPVPEEQIANVRAFRDKDFARNYLINFRLREMALRCRLTLSSVYGEVNPALKYFAPLFREFIPTVKIIHVIRDGRDVVRSVFSRDPFTEKDKRNYLPPQECIDPLQWNYMDRFEKICWVWSYENGFLRENSDLSVKFEDIILSYEKFNDSIASPLNLKIPYEIWQKSVPNPRNRTEDYSIGKWEDWSELQKNKFIQWCGEQMKTHGYTI
ncbi:MAG: hypothetical protein HYY40_03010 [Bacteroidetes bacterium]|nr:hypothetical protein [Bacteroidota bacterium]